MKKYYKLTNQEMQTYGGFQWEFGKWVEAKPKDGNYDKSLCSDAWLHCYDSPLLAILHNPIHAGIENPRLFEVETGGKTKDDRGIKRGFRKMRIVKELPIPKITTDQRIAYALLAVKEISPSENWQKWADAWLSGENRAADAARAARDAARDAAWAAAGAARDAARDAAWAAYAAAWDAARAAVDAARDAAWAAARAAMDAVDAADLDLAKIAEKAMEY